QLKSNESRAFPFVQKELETAEGESLDRLLVFLGRVIENETSPQSAAAFEELKRLAKKSSGSRSIRINHIFESIRLKMGQRAWQRVQKLCGEPRYRFVSMSTEISVTNPFEINNGFKGTAEDLRDLDQVTWIHFARLEGNVISRDILRAVLKLPELKHLQIVDTLLNAEDLSILREAPDLDILEIVYSPVNDDLLAFIQELPVWGKLWMFGTQISNEGGETAKRLLNDIEIFVSRGAYLGVRSLQNSLYIESVEPGSAAELGGLRTRDRILRINGVQLENFDDLRNHLAKFAPDEEIEIEFERVQRPSLTDNPDADPERLTRVKLVTKTKLGRRRN
ncbi:MAG: PDZ domain-containing protein, partial [Planctomycetes bacterium]|nr:PDZ domain-containing protein [Planctomycetota bacterium]